MPESIYYILYRSRFYTGKPDCLSRHSGKENSQLNVHFFDEGHLIHSENNDVGEEEDTEDVYLEEIDVVIWEIKNWL